jgi:hypothetical protein
MHFCRAQIKIGGDKDNILIASAFAPISWPEILVLQTLHGEDAVTDVEPFAEVEFSSSQERGRLARKYGDQVVSTVFGGRQGPREMEAPRAKLATNMKWRNPITERYEVVGEDPAYLPLTPRAARNDDEVDILNEEGGVAPTPSRSRRR